MGDTVSFYINPGGVGGNGKIIAIRVQNVATGQWFNYDNGVWDTPTIMITPGPGNLYIAAYVQNQGGQAALTVNINKLGTGVIATKSQNVGNSESFGLEVTTDMPYVAVGISISVNP